MPVRKACRKTDKGTNSDSSGPSRVHTVCPSVRFLDSAIRTKSCRMGLLLFFGVFFTWCALSVIISHIKVSYLDVEGSKIWWRLGEVVGGEVTNFEKINNKAAERVGLQLQLLEDRLEELEARMFAYKNRGSAWVDNIPDHALSSAGARVLPYRCSDTYRIQPPKTLFGVPIWFPAEGAKSVIQGQSELLPKQCWAFPGSRGTLSIVLGYPVKIRQVTVDHKLKMYEINTAPKLFEIYGLVDRLDEGTLLGTFLYHQDGPTTQTFTMTNRSETPFQIVEMRVLSNWGEIEYTCLYRFRVHGEIDTI